MIQIFRLNQEIFPVLPHMLLFLVPLQRLAHIERVFPVSAARGIVAIIADYAAEDGVSVNWLWVSIPNNFPILSLPLSLPTESSGKFELARWEDIHAP